MAMEIMANCNYRESLLYLEFLFKEYSYKFADCSAKNHVNFKSLLAYLGKDRTSMGTSIDEIMNSLINKNVLTEDKVEEILKRYSYEISQHGDKKYFKVKSITLQEETLALLNANYVHETVQDFIPVEIETIPETQNSVEEDVKWI
jgi:predicted transcriptional regulator